MITIEVKVPDDPQPVIKDAIVAGLDSLTSKVVDIQKENAPVRYGAPNAGKLRESIYGDFTKLDNFTAAVIQDDTVAPWGHIVNDGYSGIIKPKHAKALKIHENNSVFYRKQAHGQKAQHWWDKITDYASDLQTAFVEGFQKIFKGE